MDSISYVINNYNTRITIDELAHSAGLSRTSYIKRFRDTTGKSLKQFMSHLRITAAKKMLKMDQPISKIADECGFYDAAHFTKTFIAVTGVSPSAFKNGEVDSSAQYIPLIE